ncbi:uncharacterized protein A4U43_C07F12250 [Asparagus officinalis]|uniref:Aldehyde oxidase/xanthine dehydrogenase second molybdopterin binding domain-containing protein n=1 Tax=Asparagus officinalis TaxID=4686 RepID=A0A5P1EBE6_ASPOF|nr:uncharacterized protein A4U43_C07F12250 [Asparagus officinalis]
MFYPKNVYDIPHMRIKGQVCYTNTSSNTAFRGFGASQSMLIAKNWIERIASELQKRPEEIKEINFHIEGYVTHYGQQLQDQPQITQIAASSFNIPLSSVFISDISTDEVPNTTSTAASTSSDMYNAVVLDACEQLKEQMKPTAINRPLFRLILRNMRSMAFAFLYYPFLVI